MSASVTVRGTRQVSLKQRVLFQANPPGCSFDEGREMGPQEGKRRVLWSLLAALW